jgi:hypothetical protein
VIGVTLGVTGWRGRIGRGRIGRDRIGLGRIGSLEEEGIVVEEVEVEAEEAIGVAMVEETIEVATKTNNLSNKQHSILPPLHCLL